MTHIILEAALLLDVRGGSVVLVHALTPLAVGWNLI